MMCGWVVCGCSGVSATEMCRMSVCMVIQIVVRSSRNWREVIAWCGEEAVWCGEEVVWCGEEVVWSGEEAVWMMFIFVIICSGESSCAEGRVIGHTSSIHPLMPCVVFTGINVQLLGHLKKVGND